MDLLQNRALELIEAHGSVRAAAAEIEVDYTYLYRLSRGERKDPSDEVLRKLRLRRIVSYEDATPVRKRRAKK